MPVAVFAYFGVLLLWSGQIGLRPDRGPGKVDSGQVDSVRHRLSAGVGTQGMDVGPLKFVPANGAKMSELCDVSYCPSLNDAKLKYSFGKFVDARNGCVALV